MLKEMGSEFWDVPEGKEKHDLKAENAVFLLSGRTALEYIIKDIKARKAFKSVCLPSYCCESMIEPFKRQGIQIRFYDVFADEQGGIKRLIDINRPCDAILLLQYFGYKEQQVKETAKQCRARNITVIEDMTHSLFIDNAWPQYADYVLASLRKWAGFYTGGMAVNIQGAFIAERPQDTNIEYYSLRKKAMNLKRDYIEQSFPVKKQFLNLFNEAENLLEKDYSQYGMDIQSLEYLEYLNAEELKQKRRSNARQLLEGIRHLNFLSPVFPRINNGDTPLCVPVIIKEGKRDDFRKFLIRHNIYCPVHWGWPEGYGIPEETKALYENSLSLICDQRYSSEDIEHFIKIIRQYGVGEIESSNHYNR